MPARRLPLHETIANQLRQMIADQAFAAEGRLPSEEELARKLEVSRATIRQALWALEKEGIVVRQHGVGTFIQEHMTQIRASLDRLESFVETVRRAGYTPRVEHLTVISRPLSPTAARALCREPGSPGVFVDNLFYANDLPIVYSPTEIPADLFGEPAEFYRTGPWNSAQEYLGSRGVKVASGTLSVLAVSAQAEIASHLQVSKGHALLLLEGLSYTAKGEPVAWNRFYFNTNLFHFTLVRR